MDKNPYRPPGAPVADDIDAAPRPPQVTLACRNLWFSMAVGLLSLLPMFRGEWWVDQEGKIASSAALTAGLIMMVLFTAIYLTLIQSVLKRRNWARWTLLAFLVFGWMMQVPEFPKTIAAAPLAAAVDVTCLLIELWACYLLFLSPGAKWFEPRSR